MTNRNWCFDETLLAFELYCRLPFAKFSKSNTDVMELSALIGRTPSSVAMKLCNLASRDPEELARGIVGLKNGSKTEEEVWKCFNKDRANTILRAKRLLDLVRTLRANDDDGDIVWEYINLDDEPLESVIGEQLKEEFFKDAVLSAYDYQCAVSGINIRELLGATYIKPLIFCNINDRINPSNGICLNPLHQKAFELGLISINAQNKIMVSPVLKNYNKIDKLSKEFIVAKAGCEIYLPKKFKPSKMFIEYHNDVVFLG